VKKLPIAGSSAATTAFCAAEIKLGGGMSLWIDGNGKITRSQGDLEHPVPNAFSLRNKEDCPGMTPTCRSTCYVENLKQHAGDTYSLYQINSATIRQLIYDQDHDPTGANEAAMTLATWIRANCETFRWHVSGDVFNAKYARWIADVCREAPGVEFWIYTRSFADDILSELAQVSTQRGGNLALNLSCDQDNINHAVTASLRHGVEGKPLRLCYLTVDGLLPISIMDDDVVFPDYRLREGTEEGRAWFAGLDARLKATVCPVDYHGKAENRRCGKCSRCLT
jgi:hypothetical protein